MVTLSETLFTGCSFTNCWSLCNCLLVFYWYENKVLKKVSCNWELVLKIEFLFFSVHYVNSQGVFYQQSSITKYSILKHFLSLLNKLNVKSHPKKYSVRNPLEVAFSTKTFWQGSYIIVVNIAGNPKWSEI